MKVINKKVLIITVIILAIIVFSADMEFKDFHWFTFFTTISASITVTLIFDLYLREALIKEIKEDETKKYKNK